MSCGFLFLFLVFVTSEKLLIREKFNNQPHLTVSFFTCIFKKDEHYYSFFFAGTWIFKKMSNLKSLGRRKFQVILVCVASNKKIKHICINKTFFFVSK